MRKKIITSLYMLIIALAMAGCVSSSSSNRSFYFRDENIEMAVGEEKTLSLITNISNLNDIEYSVVGSEGIVTLENKTLTALAKGAVVIKAYSPSESITAMCSVNVLTSRAESSLTFFSDGSLYTSVIQNSGSDIVFPTNPVKSGYVFMGWYSDSSLTEKFTLSAMPGYDMTVYAKWRNEDAVVYTVTFHKNDSAAVGSMTQLALEEGSPENLPENAFKKTDYYFAGWSGSSDGSIQYADKASITLSSNIDLYAVWRIKSYTVTFDNFTNFDITEWPDNITAVAGASLTEPQKVPEAADYEFEYWYIYDETVAYNFGTMPSGGLSLKPKWRFTGATGLTLDTTEETTLIAKETALYSFTAVNAGLYYFYSSGAAATHNIYSDSNINSIDSRIVYDTTVAGSRETGINLNAGETVVLRVSLTGNSNGSLRFYASQTAAIEVRLFLNGGAGTNNPYIAVKSGSKISFSDFPEITREGFELKNWYVLKSIPSSEEPIESFSGLSAWNFDSAVTGNIILCPQWAIQSLNSMTAITLDSAKPIIQYARFGSAVFKFTAPATTTYYFTTTGDKDTYGYIYDSNGNLLYENDDVTSKNMSFNFYIEASLTKDKVYILRSEIYGVGSSIRTGAYYVKIASNVSYNVSFNSMFGTDVESQYVTRNSSAYEPAAPTRAGFEFGGWYQLDSNISSSLTFPSNRKYNFNNRITSDTKLFAKWVFPAANGTPLSLNNPKIVSQGKDKVFYYTFTPSSQGTYYFYSEGSLVDTYAALSAADPANYNMYYDEDSGSAFNFLIEATNLTAGKSYILKVLSYNDGEFTIYVSRTTPIISPNITIPSGITVGNLKYVVVGESYVVYAANSDISGEITIPASYNSIKVAGVGFSGFKDCSKITSVIFGSGIEYIGKEAFQNCTSLYSVEIPVTLTDIPMYVFSNTPFANYKNKTAKNNLGEELQEFADYIHEMLISNSSGTFKLNIIESNDVSVLGYYNGGETVFINVKAYMSQYNEFSYFVDVLDTIAHETRHHWQTLENTSYNPYTQERPSANTLEEYNAKKEFFALSYSSACSACYWHTPMEIDARDFASLILTGANTDFRHKQYSQYYSHTYTFDSCYSYDFCSDFAYHDCFSHSISVPASSKLSDNSEMLFSINPSDITARKVKFNSSLFYC